MAVFSWRSPKKGAVGAGAAPCGNQSEYEALALAQMTELFGKYGDLVELWFDGGFPPAMKAALGALIEKLQPNAVRFQGPTDRNAIRWVGTESGRTKGDDNWSTAKSSLDFGAGEPDANVWAPTECDVTMQALRCAESDIAGRKKHGRMF